MDIKNIFEYGKEYTSSGFLLTFIFTIILFITAKLVIKIFHKVSTRHLNESDKSTMTSYNFVFKIFKVLVYGIFLYLILIQFTALKSLGNILLGASSVAAMAFALAAQESMSNIVGGFFLAFSQPIKVGDLIRLSEKDIAGRVTDIGLRHTVITTVENSNIIVPNSIMNSCVIENRDTTVNYCNFLVFNISYDSNIDSAMEIIKKCAAAHKDSIANSSNNVVVINLNDFSVDLRLSVYSEDAVVGFNLCCDLRKSVKEAFDKNNIEIPFPVTTVISKK